MANHPVQMTNTEKTIMAMLECGRVSGPAWPVLRDNVDFYLDIEDFPAMRAVEHLAQPQQGDPALLIGTSGAAGLAGLIACCENDQYRQQLGLDRSSQILLIGTEGPLHVSAEKRVKIL